MSVQSDERSMQIVLIDDNEAYCESMRQSLSLHQIDCHYSTHAEEGMALLGTRHCEAVLIDIMLGSISGIDLLKEIKRRKPELPVIMITGYGTIETAVESIKYGAFDYIQKPIRFEKLLRLLATISRLNELDNERSSLKEKVLRQAPPIISKNKAIEALLLQMKKLALANLPVLITGENGTGKELFAQHLHLRSPRGHREMVTVNCAALTEGLLDNELFGHEKGAYTGAVSDHVGLFEKAHNNTLFLDEIGDMSLSTQAKILRVLQNQEIRKVGSSKTIKIDVNIIAATNKNLETLIEQGKFREDLYYRLKAAHLKIPPLRDRREDIVPLTEYFLASYSKEHKKPITGITSEVQDLFLVYHWPGNVRELRNCIHYACTMTSDSILHIQELPADILSIRNLPSERQGAFELSEKEILVKTLQRFHYNKSKCARHLHISRSTLYNKLLRYGIEG
ncbi:sigma-54-dependent transcriptional regulator [Sediminispirochaeta bajacaliforniensis]|uniref:sigma-54-dependent transcriptional regulator n=1 Tax=Sediminispirochaeta bajacaliforniensis TaxID=148 RepID=UPI00035F60D5|nr:sigma-54 dependent transcriptional regulator [Sediminispirochaeta bajacaliforniensis]